MTVASLNALIGSIDFVSCTADTAEPDIFVGDMKSKLYLSCANVAKDKFSGLGA